MARSGEWRGGARRGAERVGETTTLTVCSMQICRPHSAEQLDQVRALMRAFVAWHRERHVQDIHLIDAYFDAAAFEQELATLPGEYGPPDGELLLAHYDGAVAGCVALRRIDS